MKEHSTWKLGIAALLLIVGLAGCGGGGSDTAANPDIDGDGIPNNVDAFPSDPTRFANMASTNLAGLAGSTFGTGVAINDAAAPTVVGSSDTATGEMRGLRWTVTAGVPSVPATLEPLAGGAHSAAFGVNDAGIAVGESESGLDIVAVFWPAAGTAATALSATGVAAPSTAYSINTAGQIVGEATIAGNTQAVLWNNTNAAPVPLGAPAGTVTSTAYFITSAGIVVGEAFTAAGVARPVAWRVSAAGAVTAGPVDLGALTGHVAASAFGADATGRIVGESESATGAIHGILWTVNPTTLAVSTRGDLGVGGSAMGINAANRIAGHRGDVLLAKIWDTRNLILADNITLGAGPSSAYGINAANMIVGNSGAQGFVSIPAPVAP